METWLSFGNGKRDAESIAPCKCWKEGAFSAHTDLNGLVLKMAEEEKKGL